MRLVRPEHGALPLPPLPIVERIVKAVIPGSETHWTAAGIDEFLRAYLTPRGRVAFYAAARNIYLEDGAGSNGFWTRIEALQPRTLFIWGRRDRLAAAALPRPQKPPLPHRRHAAVACGPPPP